MLSRISRCLALLVLIGSSLSAETLQDRKLPSPVVFDAVFPQVVFGNLAPYGRFESALILANPENRTAQVELDFRYPDGQSAGEFFKYTEALAPSGLLLGTSCIYLKVAPHGVREVALPGKDSKLLEKDFNGWVVLRSNSRISAHQVFRFIDYRNVKAEVGSAGSYSATTRAEIEVGNLKWEGEEGAAKWWGWNYSQTGISVVNPFGTPASIGFTLGTNRRGFELAPHSKQAFLIGELFSSFHSNNYYSHARVLVEAQTSTPFVILGLNTFIDTDPNGLPQPRTDSPGISFILPQVNDIPGGVPFSFPEEIVAEASLGGREIMVSRLGFVVASSEAGGSEAFPANFDPYGYGVVSDDSRGVAVVYGADDTPVVFATTGHVLRIPIGSYQKPMIMAGEKPGQVILQFGITCQIWTHIIDVQTETLVSSKATYGWCL